MKGSLKLESENFVPCLERAKRRFPGRVVGGTGRWAVDTPAYRMGKVLLFATRAEAESAIVDPKHCIIVDLDVDGETILRQIPDRYPD